MKYLLKKPFNFIIEFCGGLMICVVCFYLLPASFAKNTVMGIPPIALSLASGAILYMVFSELITEAHRKSKLGTAGNFAGMVAGIIISFML